MGRRLRFNPHVSYSNKENKVCRGDSRAKDYEGHDLGMQIQETRKAVSGFLFELSVKGDWCYLPEKGRGKKRGKKTEARTNEFIQIVEVRNVCGSLLGRRHCDDSIFISRESDGSVSFKIQ